MKKLTKSKRETVRFLIKRAMHDIEVARTFTFKAYGSSLASLDLKVAFNSLSCAVKNLESTKVHQPQKPSAAVDEAKKPSDPSPKDTTPVPNLSQKYKDIEDRLRTIVCDNILFVPPSEVTSDVDLIKDLGADDLAMEELFLDVQEQFHVAILEDEAAKIHTFGQLLNCVKLKTTDISDII